MGFFTSLSPAFVPYGEIPTQYVDQALAAVAQQAGLPAGFNWFPYLQKAAEQHKAAYGVAYSKRYTNWAYPVTVAITYAASDYPQLQPFIALTGAGSVFWDQGNQLRDQALHAATSDTEYYAPVLLAAAFITAGLMAPVAATALATETAVATGATSVVQGAELAALIESGTIGIEGAFLEAAALTGSQVVYSTATGALMEAVTPAGEAILFDASVDPFTQFNVQAIEPVQSVKLPEDALNVPSAPSTPSTSPTTSITKAATDYAKKLALSELNKLVGGAAQSPGAKAALVQSGQGVAPGQESADITPLIALALVAGAYIYSKRKR
jgi:hypothetical protein